MTQRIEKGLKLWAVLVGDTVAVALIAVAVIAAQEAARISLIFLVALKTHAVLPAAAFRVVLASPGVRFANITIV